VIRLGVGPSGRSMRRLVGLLAALIAFAFVFYGLSGYFGFLLMRFGWGLAHSVTPFLSIPLMFVPLLLPLAGAFVASRGTYRWVVSGRPMQDVAASGSAARDRPSKWVVGLGLAAVLGYACNYAFVQSLNRPKIAAPQRDLVLATGQSSPTNPVVVGGNLYWINAYGGLWSSAGLRSMPKAGGKPQLICPTTGFMNDLFGDGRALYWYEDMRLVTFPLPLGPRQDLTEVGSLAAIVADQDNLYWVQDMNNFGERPNLFKMPVRGGSPAGVLPGLDFESPHGLAADSDSLYWTDWHSGSVYTVEKIGGGRRTVVGGQTMPHALVLDGEYLYWTCFGNGSVVRAAKTGRDVTVLASGFQEATALTIDDKNVYFACKDRVVKVPKAGGTVVTLADAQLNVRGVQVDDGYVYWSDGRGAIYRVGK
jgi:hypothetical protein